jgi:hypothetical protein
MFIYAAEQNLYGIYAFLLMLPYYHKTLDFATLFLRIDLKTNSTGNQYIIGLLEELE